MTKLIIETDDNWTKEKIKFAIEAEIHVLRKAAGKIQLKIQNFESKYGKLDREKLYGKIDDMELVEWEGEVESLRRMQDKIRALEEITFEYR